MRNLESAGGALRVCGWGADSQLS